MWLDLERNVCYVTLRMSNVGPTSGRTRVALQPHSSRTLANVGPLTFTRRRAAGGPTAYERLWHPSGPRDKKYAALFLLHKLAELTLLSGMYIKIEFGKLFFGLEKQLRKS